MKQRNLGQIVLLIRCSWVRRQLGGGNGDDANEASGRKRKAKCKSIFTLLDQLYDLLTVGPNESF